MRTWKKSSSRFRRLTNRLRSKKIRVGIVLASTVPVLFSAVAVATGAVGSSDASGKWQPVYNDEALPCTGLTKPVNFETFSFGRSFAGMPLTYTERRCDGGPAALRANYVSYIYGDCEIVEGATGCQPPLEIQSWPACQRYLAKYSFEGKPLPHRALPKHDRAEVVEFNFLLDNRIEVYTESATIVIFATDLDLARDAVNQLRPLVKGNPPVRNPNGLKGEPSKALGAPDPGSLEGRLACQP